MRSAWTILKSFRTSPTTSKPFLKDTVTRIYFNKLSILSLRLKFLCGDELWLEENDDEPKTKLSNSRKRKEQDEDEMARFDEQKRLRLDSNR